MKRLSGLDATFLFLETPEMPMHVGALHLFELPAGYRGRFVNALRKHMAERLPLAPALRRRALQMPLNMTNPVWIDALPDLKQHIVEVKLPKLTARARGQGNEIVARLTLMMTSSGSRRLPQPSVSVRAALIGQRARSAHGIDSEVERLMQLFTLIGSPAFRPDPAEFKARLTASVRRAWRPDGIARQMLAIAADGDRTLLLACPQDACGVAPPRGPRPAAPSRPASAWTGRGVAASRGHAACKARPLGAARRG